MEWASSHYRYHYRNILPYENYADQHFDFRFRLISIPDLVKGLHFREIWEIVKERLIATRSKYEWQSYEGITYEGILMKMG